MLDNPVALADSFTRLRGSLDWGADHELGNTRVGLSVDVSRHDVLDLEDDASLSLSTGTTIAVSDRLELRGMLSAALRDEGDEFASSAGFLASRKRLAILTAGLQAGIRLDPQTTLVLEMAATTEEAGPTRFPGTGLPSIALEADRHRLALAATAMRTHGSLSYGLQTGVHLVRAEAAALLPAIALAHYTLKARTALSTPTGHRFGAAAGIEVLDVEEPAFRQLRPAIELAASVPLATRLSLQAAASAGYDTITRDDPVAAFVRKVEAAVSLTATQRLRFAAGLLGARHDNIGLGGGQTVRAGFAEAHWALSPHWSLQMRIEASRKREMLTGAVRRAVETQVAISASL